MNPGVTQRLRAVFIGSVLSFALCVGCRGGASSTESAPEEPSKPTLHESSPAASQEEEPETCAALIARIEGLPALEGAPKFEERRPWLLARAKAEPILFSRTPKEASEGVSPEVESFRRRIALGPNQGFVLHTIYRSLKNRPEIARALLLREGYLYAENTDLAAALVHVTELHHLFREPELFIQRGNSILKLVKAARGYWYEYAEGAEKGQRARLFFLDRVAASEAELAEPLHVELRSIAYRLGFEQLRLKRWTPEHLLAELRYGDIWVPTVLKQKGTQLEFECEQIAKEAEPALLAAQNILRRRAQLVRIQQRAISLQVAEALPFDEPRTEIGQQDGNLRPAWIWAHRHGWDSYSFNDDNYSVFDAQGRPFVPQVCTDFITDTFERASGTWWTSRGVERQQVLGLLNFNELSVKNRRSVESVVNFAWDHPELFDVYDLEASERHPFIRREEFFDYLYEHRDRFIRGDVIAIHGLRSDGQMHYHSFFIYESDPVSGMPILLADNAGKARIRPWESVMRSAPLRSIKHRLRPRLGWLESILTPDPALNDSVPELSSTPS